MPPRVDDSSIADETILWRRVNQSMFDVGPEGQAILQSFAFKAPGDELSMDISGETTAEKVLAAGLPSQKVVGIKAGVLRRLGYIIVRDPEPDDPAHVLVLPLPGKSKKQKHLDRKAMALNAIWERL
jgi:hypothetical protein